VLPERPGCETALIRLVITKKEGQHKCLLQLQLKDFTTKIDNKGTGRANSSEGQKGAEDKKKESESCHEGSRGE